MINHLSTSYTVGILAVLLLGTFVFQSAAAQEQEGWLTYEHPFFGMKVDYPENWERVDSELGVDFIPPNEPVTAWFSLKTQTDIFGQTTVEDMLRGLVNEMQTLPNFRIAETDSTTLGGLPAETVTTSYTLEEPLFHPEGGTLPAGTYTSVFIMTKRGDDFYTVNYAGFESAYSRFLPTYQEMQNSVEFTE